MSLPCPHCGSQETFSNRNPEDFKSIVPHDVQGNFVEAPIFTGKPGPVSVVRPAGTTGTSVTPNSASTSSPSSLSSLVSPAVLTTSVSPSPPSATESPASLMTNLEEAVQILESIEEEQQNEKPPLRRLSRPSTRVTDSSLSARVDNLEKAVKRIEADVKAVMESQRAIEKMLKGETGRIILKK
ncbi:MAG: hypothetical protein ACFFD4_09710 [Candidatus Odinarchaeota archaeon]